MKLFTLSKTVTLSIIEDQLSGPALDWAVAKALGYEWLAYIETNGKLCFQNRLWSPSTDLTQAIPIIEQGVSEIYEHVPLKCWAANSKLGDLRYGPTPLIAAMRCYVTSILGDKIQVPEELTYA